MFAMRDGSPRQKCYRCGKLKPADDFAWRRKKKNQRDSFCRPCRSVYKREHYQANKQRSIEQAEVSKRRLRLSRTKYLLQYFEANPCSDCGETDPLVLEFDHIGDKRFTIGAAFTNKNWQEILDEIAACEVVCASCHRRRTARRGGFLRVLLTESAQRPLAP
jgi:hypothetical protein